jgi:hypothetical protein
MTQPKRKTAVPQLHTCRSGGYGRLVGAHYVRSPDLKRIVDKDALDVLRLLQACPTAELSAGLARHGANTPAHADVVRGLRILRERATKTQHDLPALAERASRGDPTVAPSFVVLVRELLATMSP